MADTPIRLVDGNALLHDFDGIDLSECVKYGNQNSEQQHRSYSTMMLYEIADGIENAPSLLPVTIGCKVTDLRHNEFAVCRIDLTMTADGIKWTAFCDGPYKFRFTEKDIGIRVFLSEQ